MADTANTNQTLVTESSNASNDISGFVTNESFIDSKKVINIKSSTEAILDNERSVRNFKLFNPTKSNPHFDSSQKSLDHMMHNKTSFPVQHMPTSYGNNSLTSISFDKFKKDGSAASVLTAKDETAPEHLFNTY